MTDFKISHEADEDLFSIGRYTDRTWGRNQAKKYAAQLESHFAALSRHDALEQAVFDHRDDFRVSRCQHHYVFFVRERNNDVLILAVLHENMDLINRFRERLARIELRP